MIFLASTGFYNKKRKRERKREKKKEFCQVKKEKRKWNELTLNIANPKVSTRIVFKCPRT
jgi:hypothetical protein